MVKINAYTPQGIVVKKVSAAARDMKSAKAKSIKIGKSGLPYEAPIENFREIRAVQMLNDSFAYDRAKNSVTIATLNQKK